MNKGDMVKIIDTGRIYSTYGDKARQLNSTKWVNEYTAERGALGIITGIDKEGFVLVDLGSVEILININGLLKVKNKIGGMMKITNFVRQVLDKDIRTVMKAGFISSDLTLTERGEDELMSLLFLEKKAELVKIAEEQLKEEKKDE